METPQNKSLFIAGLPFETTEEELRKLVAGFGHAITVKLIKDRLTGRSKGFGFVEMSGESEARAALNKLNGSLVGHRKIYVDIARPQTPGAAGSGPSGDKPAGGFKKPWAGDKRRSFGDKPGGEFKKPWAGDKRRSFGDKPGGGFKKPWAGDKRRAFGDKPGGWTEDKPAGGFKKPWAGDKRRSFGDKPGGWGGGKPGSGDGKPGGFKKGGFGGKRGGFKKGGFRGGGRPGAPWARKGPGGGKPG